MRRLNVWLECSPTPIGVLVASDNGTTDFVYTAEWLMTRANHPLSLSLPLEPTPQGDVLTRAFFDNLLQENRQFDRVRAREGLAQNDVVGLLAIVGADCAGAVSVLPEDHPPIKRPGNLATDYDELSEAEFRDMVMRLATGKPLAAEMRDPSPVAGFRDKISLAALPNGRFGLPRPQSGAPTTHILKIPDADHRHEARHEAYVTLLAHQCGLPVGTCIADDVEGQEILLIQRFDRIVEGDAVTRIHQEDFAQAAGLPAALKYERGGVTGRRFDAATIGRILAATAQPALARALFLRLTLFNLLIGNNDNHAKNHGLFHLPGDAPQLTPFYDLVPVQIASGFREDLAFNIGKARFAHEVDAADLLHFAGEIGIPASGAASILARDAHGLVTAIEALSSGFDPAMGALDRQIGAVANLLNDALGLGIDLRERDAAATSGGGWQLS